MPDGITETQIHDFLRNLGQAQPEKIKFLNDQHHMAAVKFASQEEAVEAKFEIREDVFFSGIQNLKIGISNHEIIQII